MPARRATTPHEYTGQRDTTTLPIIRWRTGDAVGYVGHCRAAVAAVRRLGPIAGRVGEISRGKGTSIVSRQVENLLYSFKGWVVAGW